MKLTEKQKAMLGVLWSAFKDLMRNVLIAVVPIALDRVAMLDLDPLIIVAVIAGLKYLDSALHKYGKEVGNEVLEKGITRF